jgi:uncharacterized LabA/DUF88 family protein
LPRDIGHLNARVYIDGFNFYFGVFKNPDRPVPVPPLHKWCNLVELGERLAQGVPVDWVGYFTAPITNRSGKQRRQRRYISALRTLDKLEIVNGVYRPREKSGPEKGTGIHRTILTYEEKGSDVNLAVRLVADGYENRYDRAIVLSNDGDLKDAVRIVRAIGKHVTVISPRLRVVGALQHANAFRTLDVSILANCVLPDPVVAPDGTTFDKPAEWA